MLDPKWLSQAVATAGQITTNDVVDAAHRGFTTIINNRPDGEGGPEQPNAATNRQAAEAQGLRYVHLPLTGLQDISLETIDAYADALDGADGAVLAHCKSGGRSTLLWALVQVRNVGRDIDTVVSDAQKAGFDLAQARPVLERFAQA